MNPHGLAELRSLRAHTEIANRIKLDPSIVQQALQRLERDYARGVTSRYYYERWHDLLTGPVDSLTEQMQAEHEEALSLRQASPFAGVLGPKERWTLWKDARKAFEARAVTIVRSAR
jgi:DNA-binding MarR family transcriptional regulator